MNWVTMIGGVVLFFAPFITGYSNNPAALWTSLIMGVVLVVLGYLKQYIWAAVAGLVVFVAPWLLGFSSISAALWNCLMIGGVVAIGNGYMAYSQGGTHRSQHA